MAARTEDEPVAEKPAEGTRAEEEKQLEHRRQDMEARRRALVSRGEARPDEPTPTYEEKKE